MTNKNSTKRALLASVMAVFLCFTMLLGTTFAWFTDSATSAGNKIIAGNLNVDLQVLDEDDEGNYIWESVKENKDPIFTYEKWEPGYTEVKFLKVVNLGTLALKWKAMLVTTADIGILADVIDVYVKEYASDATPTVPTTRDLDGEGWTKLNGTLRDFIDNIENTTTGEIKAGESEILGIAFKMQESAGNNYQKQKLGAFDIIILATQLDSESDSFGTDYDVNAEYPVINTVDTWNGVSDTSWYNDTDTEFTLSTAEQLAGLAELVDGGNDFAGKTITLSSDLDLYAEDENGEPISFEPVGSYRNDVAFKGTFDGQGHTIKNLNQNTWALNNGYYYGDLGLGLFGKVEDATIKNLNMDGASISGESAMVGIVAGAAYGECTFENITVTNSKGNDYQYYAGGVVGWASGNHVYKGINIDASTTIGSQWGDFGNANGGIIGGAGTSGEYHFEDCTVACRIDATNDVVSAYQWYSYRNSGMLIGRVGPETIVNNETANVTADNVTCKNVTVIYGDWANYTYCEFAGTGYPYVRVQAGVSVDGYSNVRYGHPTDANGNTVVDDNHVHNDGEDHHKLIAFDQLFGGPANQRYCYYGINEHPGVTVIYNNK